MTIIESHNGTTNATWYKWLKSGLNNVKLTVHPLAKIGQYPKTKDTTLLNIGLYMLDNLPELDRFCTLSPVSRHHEPICNHTKPMISGLSKIQEVDGTVVEQVNPTKATATNVNTTKKSVIGMRPPGQNPDANEFSPKKQLFTN